MNKSKKLVLVSLSTALSFVLIMGLETVFSSTPSANPPATNLTPTFNGLTVKNFSTGEEFLSISPSTAPSMSPLAGPLIIGNENTLVDIKGESIFLDTKDMYLKGKMAIHLNKDGSQGDGGLDIGGPLYIADVNNEGSLIDGDLMIGNSSSSSIGNLSVNGKLSVNGNISDLNFTSSGVTDEFVVYNDLTVQGNINANGHVYSSDLVVNGAVIGNNITAYGSVHGTDITAYGKIKANSIGTYTTYDGALRTVYTLNDRIDLTFTCPSGSVPINCGWDAPTDYVDHRSWSIDTNYIAMKTNSCVLKATNRRNGTNQIKYLATCFTPNL